MGNFCDRSFRNNNNNCIYDVKGEKTMLSIAFLAGIITIGAVIVFNID